MINDFKLTKDFNLKEFQCACCGQVKIDSNLVFLLQVLRDWISRPIIITSGYRCPKHNREVGGESNSYHLQGLAVDITGSFDIEKISELAREIGFRGIGIYKKKRFLHLDLGTPRTWEG